MINSMTGYGYNECLINEIKFFITIKSVNSRYLDININLPLDLQYLEEPITKILKNYFERGKFDIYIGIDKSTLALKLELNESLLEEYIKLLKAINKRTDEQNRIKLSDIVNPNEIINTKHNKEKIRFNQGFKIGLLKAINQLQKMRQIEGRSIYNNFKKILDNMAIMLSTIHKKLPRIIQDYQNKLKSKIKNLVDVKSYDENRILMEVALLADKMDINEEIERLKSHIQEMKKYIAGKKSCGKLLEFILQEMLRETNAIGSKVSEVSVTKNVINMKEAIEQMREQAKNVE